MNNVHAVLQGKGGVGKSLIAATLAQAFKRDGRRVVCADTDPVNRTFCKYLALDVAGIDIVENGIVNTRKFDPLMELILATDADFVIDNGASTFLPLTRYFAENDIYKLMTDHGKKVYIHTVLVGGQAQSDTYDGLVALLNNVSSSAKVVIWENEFWGPVKFGDVSITSSKVFREAEKAGKIAGVVKIIDRNRSDTFPGDVKQMTTASLTLREAQASTDFTLVAKLRLNTFMHDIFAELDKIEW